MVSTIGSVAATPYVPQSTETPKEQDAPVSATKSSVSATEPTAASSSAARIVSDSTLGELVSRQALSVDAESDQDAPARLPLDLSGRDLREIDLATFDLRGADLSGANLAGADLSGLDLTGAKLDGADLSGALIDDVDLSNVSARGANFSNARIHATTLDGADFTSATFDGARLGGLDGESITAFTPPKLVFANAKLDDASFVGATLERVRFSDSTANGADFSNIDAQRISFSETELVGASFDGASGYSIGFRHSDMSGARLTNMSVQHKGFGAVTLDDAKFAGTSFDHTTFITVNLTTADLADVVRSAQFSRFNQSNLAGVDFSDFDFFSAKFDGRYFPPKADSYVPEESNPSLDGTNFAGANLAYAWFESYDLAGADFSNATFKRTLVNDLESSALAGVFGVHETMGDAWTPAEMDVIMDMRAGRRPVTSTFEFHDAPQRISDRPGDFYYFDVSDEERAIADWKAPGSDDAASASAEDGGAAEAAAALASPADVDPDAALALKTLTAVNDRMRAARDEDRDNTGVPGLVRDVRRALDAFRDKTDSQTGGSSVDKNA